MKFDSQPLSARAPVCSWVYCTALRLWVLCAAPLAQLRHTGYCKVSTVSLIEQSIDRKSRVYVQKRGGRRRGRGAFIFMHE